MIELPPDDAVVIRRLTAYDAEELARLLVANRDAHAPFQPARPEGFFSVETQRERLATTEQLYGILDDGVLAGVIELSNLARGPFESANLGYWVDEARCGRGLATRAVAAIVGLAFAELGLHRLEAATLVDNVASQRVLQKNRFQRIGLAPRYLQFAGEWRDHLLFQRTVED
jgi:[ribosomal protein S5]-alanine N-acetyltransferase